VATSEPAIRVESLGKRYVIGGGTDWHPTLRDVIAARFGQVRARIGRRSRAATRRESSDGEATAEQESRSFWALRDVTLTIASGEVVGVIGSNGAGKSTLLKILSRITDPTEGTGIVHGRVGSLLEVGTGFHPELTGRENVYLNGVIIGMSRNEIARRFDEIVAFSGVERFIDTPVKRYSSGMYLRLAFSVAAHLEPEILLIDEVLAVGDAEFQKKCLGKIGDVARGGRTVLFVSHNLTALQALCDRGLYFREGRLVADGEPRAVVAQYLAGHSADRTERTWEDRVTAPGLPPVRLRRACVRPERGDGRDGIDVRTAFAIEIDYENQEEGALLSASVRVIDEQGTVVFHAGPLTAPSPRAAGTYRDTCHVPGDLMNDGVYRVEVEIQKPGEILLTPIEVLQFTIVDSSEFRAGWHGKWLGAVRPMFAWDTEQLDGPRTPTH
jgi:lipopolysaccharide transport system ATP-binding protein